VNIDISRNDEYKLIYKYNFSCSLKSEKITFYLYILLDAKPQMSSTIYDESNYFIFHIFLISILK